MGYKSGILVIALVLAAGCLAAPKLNEDTEDFSQFFFDQFDPDTRLVGGTAAAEGSVPYMVALTTGSILTSFLCGGSLVTFRHVLTAAHCTDAVFSWGSLSSSLRGRAGTNRWSRDGVQFRFARNISHPHYVSSTIKNDISILVINGDLTLTNVISPVALDFSYVGEGVLSRVAGWGRIRTGGSLSAQLLELFVPTIDGGLCAQHLAQAAAELNFRAPPVEPHIEICTYHAPGHGTCNGDSGSALVRLDRQAQIGIVSWGLPCARGAPDMFVRLSSYREWILDNVY